MTLLALLTLTGCDAFNKVADTIDGLLNPVAAQGLVLGIGAADNPLIEDYLAGTDFEGSTAATIFLADAEEVTEIENTPLDDATVRLVGPGVDAGLPLIDSGTYALDPTEAATVVYTAGDVWTLRVTRPDGNGTMVSEARLELPPDADFSDQLPLEHEANTGVQLDFSGLDYNAALIVVINEDGDVTWSNEPETIKEFYDFTRGSTAITSVDIPGEAFQADMIHAVGVAGLQNTDADDLTEMNTALASVLYGKMNFYAVSTRALPDMP